AVVTSPHAGVRSSMGSLFEPGFGGTAQQWGPNWGLFRPYHLACVEVPMSVARAIIQGRPTGDLRGGMVAELVAVAKKALAPGDDHPLYVGSSLVDLHALGVPPVALDRKLRRVAAGAVDEDRLVGRAHGGVTAVELGHGEVLGVHGAGRAPGQQAGGVELGLHVGKGSLDHLEVADALPELAPVTREVEAGVQARLMDADRA